MMQPVITHVLCRCPRDGKLEWPLVPEAQACDPTERRQAAPLAKYNILSPRPAELVLDPRAHERREEL
jgi:hypothetical protein